MGEHDTWFTFIPGFKNLEAWASHYLGRSWQLGPFQSTHFTLTHVAVSLFVFVLLVMGALVYNRRLAMASGNDRLLPDARLSVRTVFELVLDFAMNVATSVMGREKAERFFPLVGTLFFFILFNNLIGLVPGFVPATDTLKTNVGLAMLVFVLTHVFGLVQHGPAYLKQFIGPVWWLAPLMLPIELISHVVRPVSLSLRLMGNMVGDHKVLSLFFGLIPLFVPLPFYVLGILVCVVQTLVFTLLSMVYIELAISDAH